MSENLKISNSYSDFRELALWFVDKPLPYKGKLNYRIVVWDSYEPCPEEICCISVGVASNWILL